MLPTTLANGAYVTPLLRKEIEWSKPIQIGAKAMAARRVQEFLSLQGFKLDIDSDFGSATEKRVKDFQQSRGLPVTGVVDFATHEKLVDPLVRAVQPIAAGHKTLSRLTADYALQHVAQHPRETAGPNSGPWVRTYLGFEGNEAKWCSGFVCYALEQAAHTLGVGMPIPASSSCDVMAAGAKSAHKFLAGSKVKSGAVPVSTLVPGSLFLVRATPTDWTHIGIVSEAASNSFDTIEGNTDSQGSNNGFEATERTRGYDNKDFIVW